MPQDKQRAACIELCKKRGRLGTALDVGANIGYFTLEFAQYFEQVIAFEPADENFSELQNRIILSPYENIQLLKFALGEKESKARLDQLGFTDRGAYRAIPDAQGDGLIITLDQMNLSLVDLIKIDVESWAWQVIKGSEKTIKRHKPIVLVEQKNHKDLACDQFAALDQLIGWGYKVHSKYGDDWLLELK